MVTLELAVDVAVLVPRCVLHLVLTSTTYPPPLRASQSEKDGLGSKISSGLQSRLFSRPPQRKGRQRCQGTLAPRPAPPLPGPAPDCSSLPPPRLAARESGRGRRRSLGPAGAPRGRHGAASRPLVEREARVVGSLVPRAGAGPRAGPRSRSRYRGSGGGAGLPRGRFPARESRGSLIPTQFCSSRVPFYARGPAQPAVPSVAMRPALAFPAHRGSRALGRS